MYTVCVKNRLKGATTMDRSMRDHLLSIGEMAEANRVSIATLRLYDRMGLLKPSYRDAESNYRYYDIRQTSRLDIIRYLQNLGMSLAEIQALLEKEDIILIEQKLIERNNQIHQQMRDLEAMHEAVERAIQSIERYRKSPASGTISLEFIDQRHILYIPCQENFYDGGVVAYEKAVGELRRELMRRNVPQLLSYSLGTSVKREDFHRQVLTADKIFIFGDKHLRDYGENFQVIESGMFACLYLDDFDQEAEGARKLLAYCQANRYTPSGDYLCEEMTELNLFDHRKRNMFIRLQVPVTFSKNL